MRGLFVACALILALIVARGSSAEPAEAATFREELVEQVPKLALLRQHDPAAFEPIAAIHGVGEREGRPTGGLVGLARDDGARMRRAELARAPDALVLASIDSTIAVARDLERAAPEVCAAMFLGERSGDVEPFRSPSTMASEDRVHVETLRTAPGAPMPVATQAEEAEAVRAALRVAAARMGLDGPIAVRTASGRAPAQAVCRAQAQLLAALRAGEPAKAAAVFRQRFTDAD